MEQQTKKKILVGLGIATLIVGGLFIRNKLEDMSFKPVDRDLVVTIMKKAKKQNYQLLRQIYSIAFNMIQHVGQAHPEWIKEELRKSESPIKIPDQLEATYEALCRQSDIKYDDFKRSLKYYAKEGDKQIGHLVEDCEKDLNLALNGQLPQLEVVIPSHLTKEKIFSIRKKLTMKRYLFQIQMYRIKRKLKGVPKERQTEDLQLIKSLPNQYEEQQKILEDELGVSDDPPGIVFVSAIAKHQKDQTFINKILDMENSYKKIYQRYLPKMEQQTMTQDQINQLQNEILHFDLPKAGGF